MLEAPWPFTTLCPPRTQTSLSRWKLARKRRREGENRRDGALPFPWSPLRVVTSHSRFARASFPNHAKNEAPEEEEEVDPLFFVHKLWLNKSMQCFRWSESSKRWECSCSVRYKKANKNIKKESNGFHNHSTLINTFIHSGPYKR